MGRRTVQRLLLAAALFVAGPAVGTALACPSCKAANETDSRRPTAYMYSILFMLAMPATLFAGFGIGFYRLSRQQPKDGVIATSDEFPQE